MSDIEIMVAAYESDMADLQARITVLTEALERIKRTKNKPAIHDTSWKAIGAAWKKAWSECIEIATQALTEQPPV